MASKDGTYVRRLYLSVVDEVVINSREAFLDEGVDESVLHELKQIWESKLLTSKALEANIKQHQAPIPAVIQQQQQQSLAYELPFPIIPQPHIQGANSSGSNLSSSATAALYSAYSQMPTTVQVQQQGNGQTFASYQVIQPRIQPIPYQDGSTGGTTVYLQSASSVPGQAQQQQTTSHSQPSQPKQRTDKKVAKPGIIQVDGAGDSSSEDEDEEYEEGEEDTANNSQSKTAIDTADDENDGGPGALRQEEEPLNSGDDVSEEDPHELFETDNVIVCQYEKINRSKNRWKFYLKDGIMNLDGRDYVFHKAGGDAEW